MRTCRWWHSYCLSLWLEQGSSRAGQQPQLPGPSLGEFGSWHLHALQEEARLTFPIWGHCMKGFYFRGSIFRCLGPPPTLTTASGFSSDSIAQGGRGDGFLSWDRTQSVWNRAANEKHFEVLCLISLRLGHEKMSFPSLILFPIAPGIKKI